MRFFRRKASKEWRECDKILLNEPPAEKAPVVKPRRRSEEAAIKTSLVSLTEELASANCELEEAAQEENHLREKDADENQLEDARTRTNLARARRDMILMELYERVQSAPESTHEQC